MRINSVDPSEWPTHRLAFTLEIYAGSEPSSYSTNRVERLITHIRDELDRPDIGSVADGTWYQTYEDAHRAIVWFVELCRDLSTVYADIQTHRLVRMRSRRSRPEQRRDQSPVAGSHPRAGRPPRRHPQGRHRTGASIATYGLNRAHSGIQEPVRPAL